ncbi:alcohol dehydrogenase cytochrome c subunit precursor [mine drainage metagenome]|uniref:Alcohol dehydrogenase cytochrome c subunit n=1 Tax=mine drainage metagenome TaxID=410659 RepID=A0A1J5S4T1_9ZZZZ
MSCRFGLTSYAGMLLIAILMNPAFAISPDSQADEQVKRGEYLAHLGDCIACHTAKDGKSMAGGLEFKTPFGIVHSTNITPDVKTGIGSYSLEQFDLAMRTGVAADGHNLYPAMPYPSFAKISADDMKALYAYVMHGVEPVSQPNKENSMQWPFSMRFGLKFWNMAFLEDTTFKPDPAKSSQWNRGAYLVQGLGHCGSCHTPRGFAMQETTMTQDGDRGREFLAGSTVENWHAVNLRNQWSQSEFASFLKTGRNSHATAYGTMTEVVHFSTQLFSEGDLSAIGEYLNSLPSNTESEAIKPKLVAQIGENVLYKTRGGLGYVQFCATCHQNDGRGMDKFFPPLANNSSIQSKNPTSVIHVVLSGWKAAETEQAKHAFSMPSYESLSDQELTEIVTFVRTQWGNQGEPVSAEEIRKVRDEIGIKPTEPSKFTVPRYASMLSSPNADQLIYGMRLMTDTMALLPKNVGDVLVCNSCHLNGGTMEHAAPYVGLAALFPSYAPRAGKIIDFKDRVNGCMRRSMNGKPLEKDSREMLSMIAYMDNMKGQAKADEPIPGRGVGKIDKSIIPNVDNGKKIYKDQCAVCHGDKGEGLKQADGRYVFPPLWGNQSFNIGAGIAKTYTAAAFVKNNMPISNTRKFPLGQGGLTDQEAVDVAQYFTHMPRPDYADKRKDWPKGGKPTDARY